MARLKLERAGKRMRSKKFRVLIDGDEVGTLQKWGDSDEFKVGPGSHTVNIKSFGAKTGSLGVDFTDDGIVDLLCGFGEGPVEGNFAPILIWTRVEELDPQAVQDLFDRGEGFVEAAFASWIKRVFMSLSRVVSNGRNLRATMRSKFVSSALYTSPIPPSPSFSRIL